MVRNSNTTLPCLIDELKPIFQVVKNGTHWVKYKGKKTILMRVVMRDGKIIEISSIDIVPGDIIFFNVGDNVTADCRILEIENLQSNESSLTG